MAGWGLLPRYAAPADRQPSRAERRAGREDVNATFLQPFLAYALGHGTTISLNAETSYDWVANQWTVPINLGVSQVFKIGGQAMSFQVGGKRYAEAPEGGPEWGIRMTLTLLFPKK
jgi:hypothetical protein